MTALHHLLDDVTTLARLQAGQEERRVAAFDAAELLHRLAENVRPAADAKGLFIKTEGPGQLAVEGDAVKVRRIAQNLVLNAIKYTRVGGVTIAWGATADAAAPGWRFSVEDSGPGFHSGPGAPIVGALNPPDVPPATLVDAPDAEVPGPSDHAKRPISQEQGEGLGLAIVKRLC
ncbi:MAG: HAMP domain-containing sensor histidine kinase, partial [Caldimonas sp.]